MAADLSLVGPMSRPSTKERLVSAAEKMFAQEGFGGTSLRKLTQMANVNLAAVNYHFGSKDQLIRAVLERGLDDLYRRRGLELDRLSQQHEGIPPLAELLFAFIRPALTLTTASGETGSTFMQVLARAYLEYREELRSFMSERYGETNSRFFSAIGHHLRHLPRPVIHARIDFFIGALTYAMSDFGAGVRSSDSDTSRSELLSRRLVEFSMAGLTAPCSES